MKYIAVLASLLVIGGGCYAPKNPPAAQETKACIPEGQRPGNVGDQCCPGLELVAADHASTVCGKPGTGYVPKSCAEEGESIFVDTPVCCGDLQPILKDNKYVCSKS